MGAFCLYTAVFQVHFGIACWEGEKEDGIWGKKIRKLIKRTSLVIEFPNTLIWRLGWEWIIAHKWRVCLSCRPGSPEWDKLQKKTDVCRHGGVDVLIHPTSVDFSIAQYTIFVMYIFICIMDMHVLIRITHTLCISYIILLCVYGCVLVFFLLPC